MGRTAGAAALGFVLGCAVTYFLARRKAKEREGGGGWSAPLDHGPARDASEPRHRQFPYLHRQGVGLRPTDTG